MSERIVSKDDSEWPRQLDELGGYRPPARLYVTGRPLPPFERCIAIVGTRRPTSSALEMTRELASGLVEAGFIVVSGLAIGIDAAAHAAALDKGGHTVGVLGCGLDVPYPERNLRLKRQMADRGTLVSEYPPGTQPFKPHFPERNRIIAGLATGVIVVEGGPKSGALITARRAIDSGRSVWAVPGSVRNPMATGPNELIRAGQAALITSLDHVFEELAPRLIWEDHRTVGPPPDLEEDDAIVLSALDDVPTSVDRISRAAGFDGGRLALALARLEIRSFARKVSLGYTLTEAGARARAAAAAISSG